MLAVPMIENPFAAGTSVANSATATRYSESNEINASCTSAAHRVISSNRASVPLSIARNTGDLMSASWLGPRAISIA